MGKPKINNKKKSKAENIVPISTRVLRSKYKKTKENIQVVENIRVSTKTIVKRIDSAKKKNSKDENIVPIPARVLRSTENKTKENTQQKLSVFKSIPVRVLRSKEKKAKENIQEPVVKNNRVPCKKIVKRIAFVKVETFKKNDIVLAKQKYSVPWPARIVDIQKEKVSVHFFGDRRNGFVNSSDLFDFITQIFFK